MLPKSFFGKLVVADNEVMNHNGHEREMGPSLIVSHGATSDQNNKKLLV